MALERDSHRQCQQDLSAANSELLHLLEGPVVLAAVDLDQRATAVIVRAADLAATCQGRLVLIHVVDYQGGYAPDQPFTQRPDQVLEQMARHSRYALLGMVMRLSLPSDWVEILVETGPLAPTLAQRAAALNARYLAVGRARLGPLSPTATLAPMLEARPGCELVVVPDAEDAAWRRMLADTRRWLSTWQSAPERVAE